MSSEPIVVGTDGSPTANLAVDRAAELAHALGASVHVVCVPSGNSSRTTAKGVVAEAGDRLQGRGITVETHVPDGEGAPALIAVAEHEGAQMIVVGNKGMTGIRRVLGSFPNDVSHQARCGVLVVRTNSRSLAEFGGSSIVVGTDGTSDALGAVREAIRLSKALGAALHIVSVYRPATTVYVPPASPEAAVAAAAAEASDHGVNATTHVTRDEPVDALIGVADQNDAAIIAISRTGLHPGQEALGSVPEMLSHKGAASVLIVSGAAASGSDRDGTGGEAVAAAEDPGAVAS
jgi:nucleotide-binding universal stress UspA family protein